jgi:hypothetical protein
VLAVPAPLVVNPPAKLTSLQKSALQLAAASLPDGWEVVVNTEDEVYVGLRFTVRVLGDGYSSVAGFAGATRPEQLSAFVERAEKARSARRR